MFRTSRRGRVRDATIVERDLAVTPVDEWPSVRVSGVVTGGVVRHARVSAETHARSVVRS
jgi:hypothetical protein